MSFIYWAVMSYSQYSGKLSYIGLQESKLGFYLSNITCIYYCGLRLTVNVILKINYKRTYKSDLRI